MSVEHYFETARERYKIMLKRREDPLSPPPWTDDYIFRSFRFCNVFREDDKVTCWLRPRVTEAAMGDALLGATALSRFINRIETMEFLGSTNPLRRADLWTNWHTHGVPTWAERMRERLRGVAPLVTGAYIVKTPDGMNKLEGVICIMSNLLPHAAQIQRWVKRENPTLEEVHARLREFPYIGAFMAYEIVSDLRHTLMQQATDINSWAAFGPGAARGLSRVFYNGVGQFRYTAASGQREMRDHAEELLIASRHSSLWPESWPSWEMREVEHWACEYDKYCRAGKDGRGLKQRYRGGAR